MLFRMRDAVAFERTGPACTRCRGFDMRGALIALYLIPVYPVTAHSACKGISMKRRPSALVYSRSHPTAASDRPTNCLMLELAVLFISTLPFLLGLYALKVIERRRNDDGDSPPPPDNDPPAPVSPSPVAPVRHRPDPRPRADRSGDRGPARPSSRTPVAPARRTHASSSIAAEAVRSETRRISICNA